MKTSIMMDPDHHHHPDHPKSATYFFLCQTLQYYRIVVTDIVDVNIYIYIYIYINLYN